MKRIVKNWILQAELDLNSAQYNFQGERYDVAVYLCHQAVEKGLKALYLKVSNELWKTHDLVKLCTLVKAPEKFLEGAEKVLKWIKRLLK